MRSLSKCMFSFWFLLGQFYPGLLELMSRGGNTNAG